MTEPNSEWMQDTMSDTGRASQGWLLRAIQRRESFLYALLTNDGAVKFGVTIDLMNRKGSHISYGGTKHILAYRPGTHADEQALHKSIPVEYRILGSREYYYPVREILEYINPMREWMGIRPLRRKALPRLPECKFHGLVLQREADLRRKSA